MTHERSGPDMEAANLPERPAREADAPRGLSSPAAPTSAGAPLLGPTLIALQRFAGNRAVSGLVQRVPRRPTPDEPSREWTRPDVTGRYESTPESGRRVTLQLNQAGRYLRGWWQTHAGGVHMARTSLTGNLVSEPEDYNRAEFEYDRPATSGPEVFRGNLAATRRSTGVVVRIIDPQYGELFFEQRSSAPRLSEEAITGVAEERGSDLDMRDLVRASETSPLDREDEVRLRQAAEEIRERLVAYLGTGQEGAPGRAAALRVDETVGRWLQPFDAAQRPLVIARLRQGLIPHELRTASVTRPAWDWLQVMVVSHADVTGNVQTHLGLRPVAGIGPGQHQYRYRFQVRGLAGDVGVGLGGFLGTFEIQKTAPQDSAWTAPEEYFTVMGQVSGGLSAGWTTGQYSDWSQFSSPFNWTTGSFRGPYMITGGQAGGAIQTPVGGTGGSQGAAVIIFEGDGSYPSLMADAGGFQRISGLSAGADVSLATGYLSGGRDEAVREARLRQRRAVSSHQAAVSVHFAVADASLNVEGRRAVRSMCATHRAAFESDSSVLRIDGHASTTGGTDYNRQLSQARAQSVLNTIRAVLGPAYRIPPPRGGDGEIAVGHGEEEALRAAREQGLPETMESAEWRRVDVTLNGIIVLTLHSA